MRDSLAFAAVFGLLLAPGASHAGARFFGTTTVFFNSSVLITAYCRVFNAGSKPVQIQSAGIVNYQTTEAPVVVDAAGCTDAPLEPQRSCNFAASLGVYAGGFVMVKGSTKNLRGECAIFRDDTTTAVMVIPMR
jgi:hypothetical protein